MPDVRPVQQKIASPCPPSARAEPKQGFPGSSRNSHERIWNSEKQFFTFSSRQLRTGATASALCARTAPWSPVSWRSATRRTSCWRTSLHASRVQEGLSTAQLPRLCTWVMPHAFRRKPDLRRTRLSAIAHGPTVELASAPLANCRAGRPLTTFGSLYGSLLF